MRRNRWYFRNKEDRRALGDEGRKFDVNDKKGDIVCKLKYTQT